MKVISFSIIIVLSLSLISCTSPAISNNSNTVSAPSISSSSSPTETLTPLLEEQKLQEQDVEEQAKTEIENPEESALLEDSTTSEKITEEVTKQFPEPTTVLILPTRNEHLDDSVESEAVTENAAVRLRRAGYTVQTARQANVASAINGTIRRPNTINRASIGRLGTTLGVGAIILVALATAKENEMSVTTSIYASNQGVFEEVSRSESNLKRTDENVANEQTNISCTKNLLTNGDFERDWAVGWMRTYGDLEQGGGVTEVIEQSNGSILHMQYKGGESHVALHQTVRVPEGRMFFEFETKFAAREGPIAGFTGTGTAGLNIVFLDANKKFLGLLWAGSYQKNVFEGTGLVGVPQGPQSNNSASFMILPNNQTVRERLEITRIARDRLGKLDLNKIRYVAINISVGATHNSASAEAWVDNLSLEICQ